MQQNGDTQSAAPAASPGGVQLTEAREILLPQSSGLGENGNEKASAGEGRVKGPPLAGGIGPRDMYSIHGEQVLLLAATWELVSLGKVARTTDDNPLTTGSSATRDCGAHILCGSERPSALQADSLDMEHQGELPGSGPLSRPAQRARWWRHRSTRCTQAWLAPTTCGSREHRVRTGVARAWLDHSCILCYTPSTTRPFGAMWLLQVKEPAVMDYDRRTPLWVPCGRMSCVGTSDSAC